MEIFVPFDFAFPLHLLNEFWTIVISDADEIEASAQFGVEFDELKQMLIRTICKILFIPMFDLGVK